MTDVFKGLVKSRKFWIAVGTVVVRAVCEAAGVPASVGETVVMAGGALIAGHTVTDVAAQIAGKAK